MEVEFSIENAALQRSAMSIENGLHTGLHSSGVLCVGTHIPLHMKIDLLIESFSIRTRAVVLLLAGFPNLATFPIPSVRGRFRTTAGEARNA